MTRKRSGQDGAAGVASPPPAQRPAGKTDALWALRLIDASPISIASVDLAGVIIRCNAAFARMAGSDDADELRMRPLADLFARGDRDDVKRQLSKLVMGTAKSVRIDGFGADNANGAAAQLALIAFPLVDHAEVSQIGVYVVAEMERGVDGAALAQRQKMQAVGQLAGGIAHDFNNLLTAMLGFCELLLARHQPGDLSHDEILQVRDNALRAAALVRQLLAFSRKQTLNPTRLNVGRALADLVTMLPRLLGPAIELRLEQGADVGDIEVDPIQFDQIVINLAVNARDAMPGGGTLSIRTRQMRLSAAAECAGEVMPAGEYVCIDVSDTGVGIPKEIIGHIFEPFFTTKDAGSGTGLGLATVFGIVRQTGGFTFVDSALGEGTMFTVMLPVLDAEQPIACGADAAPRAAADEPPVPPQGISRQGGQRQGAGDTFATVLIVDDADPIRVFAARALRKAGFRVLEAVSGEQALEVIAARPEPIDILLTDVMMPGMDGYALAQLARRDHPGMRVIAMSGYQEDVLLAGRSDDGEVSFLAKPFTLAELTERVRDVLKASVRS